MNTPPHLRTWFLIHFLVDYSIAIPIFLFPNQMLGLFGWKTIDPIATRLVAGALLGIGGASFISRNSEVTVYRSLLSLKIIWSLFAIGGIVLSAFQDRAPFFSLIALIIFIVFSSVWIYYYLKMKSPMIDHS